MKLLFVIAVVLGLTTSHSMAQGAQGVLVKNRAKAVTGAAPATPAGGAPAAPRPGIDPAQQQNIDKLGTDLGTIVSGIPATAQQIDTVKGDIAVLAKGGNKPSDATLAKVAKDLSAALAEKGVSTTQQPQLAKAINVLVNCGNLTLTQVQAFSTNAQKILKDGGLTDPKLQTVMEDLKLLVAEVQGKKSAQ